MEVVEADMARVDEHENSLVRDVEAAALAKTRLTLHDNGDGTVSGHFTVPELHGHLLRKILESMTAPRRGKLGASESQVGEGGIRTDRHRACGQAFCELLEHLPADRLHGKVAATVVVMVDEADGCERPFAWCELHHRKPWSVGGTTELAQAVPLCWFHHRRIHDGAFVHRELPDGSILFHRRS